jgi:uncharacterized membrane protein (UPF0127 family)
MAIVFFRSKGQKTQIPTDEISVMSPVMNRAVVLCLLLLAGRAVAQDTAQVALSSVTLNVAGRAVLAEVADEPHERKAGLMFRDTLAPNRGMLFVMPKPDRAAFWMKNTRLPLSVAYINPGGVIVEIHDLEPLDEKPVPSAFPNIAYALEMKQGWFAENGVLAGDRIKGLPPLTGR